MTATLRRMQASKASFARIDAEIRQQNRSLSQQHQTTVTDRQGAFLMLAERLDLDATPTDAEGVVTDYLERAEVFASQEA